jgi:hypothetical protein
MTVSTAWRDDFGTDDLERLPGNGRAQQKLGATALTVIVLACAWALWNDVDGFVPGPRLDEETNAAAVFRPAQDKAAVAAAYSKLAQALTGVARRSRVASAFANADEVFFGSHYLGSPGAMFADVAAVALANQSPATASAAARVRVASAAPLDTPRPASLRQAPAPSVSELISANRMAVHVPAEKPTIFERLFGKPSPLTLAYAAPDDAGLAGVQSAARYDHATAVYDISAHTVYLPDGTKLEAHSGFGPWLDDPHYTNERMRGATPVAVYDLHLREGLFHGVQALRLIPTDESRVFGRSGLLAHSFMLGPNGQSNGCVSFRNYYAFLHAYLSGEIKKLVVVARLD